MNPPTSTIAPAAPTSHQAEPKQADLSDGKLVLVFAVLLAVLATSAVLSRHLQGALGTGVALALAAVKLALIFWFFMRLRTQSGVVRLFAAAGFLWLVIAGVLTCADYLTRS